MVFCIYFRILRKINVQKVAQNTKVEYICTINNELIIHNKTSNMETFTVRNGQVEPGINVCDKTAKSGDKYKIVSVGESGRGRYEASVPVRGAKSEKIFHAKTSQTAAGNPCLIALEQSADNEFCIIKFETGIGFRGSNDHTGGRLRKGEEGEAKYIFRPFPGEIIAKGTIAQGNAGRMGSGEEILAVMPKNTWFRVVRNGRLYGSDGVHYGYFDGGTVKMYTPDDADGLDLDLFAEKI